MMRDIHHGETNYKCETEHIERVKPYGPHPDHLVVDLLISNISYDVCHKIQFFFSFSLKVQLSFFT
jgi:hypothetical protein